MSLKTTWTSVMPRLIAAIESGTEAERKEAKAELMRLARLADEAAKEVDAAIRELTRDTRP